MLAVVEKWPTRVFEISGTVRVRAAAEPVLPSRIVCPSENRKYAPNPSYLGTYHDSGSYALVGQTIDWKQSISIGAGISVPNDWSHRFKKAPVLNLDYGYRLKRHIQADIGIETVINGWDTYELCRFSSTPVTNAGLVVPFGGRVLLPFTSERVLLSAGAGGAYLHYTSACAAAGIGQFAAWDAYSLAGASVALDKAKRFGLGFLARYHRAYDRGYFQDGWLNLYIQFAVAFK